MIVDDVRVRAVGLTQRPRETRSEGSNGDPPRETVYTNCCFIYSKDPHFEMVSASCDFLYSKGPHLETVYTNCCFI